MGWAEWGEERDEFVSENGQVRCSECGALMLNVTVPEDGDDLCVFWCPRCETMSFVDRPLGALGGGNDAAGGV